MNILDECPLCEGVAVWTESLKARLCANGMMVPVPMCYWQCETCEAEYCGMEQFNRNATAAHLLLNQYSNLDGS